MPLIDEAPDIDARSRVVLALKRVAQALTSQWNKAALSERRLSASRACNPSMPSSSTRAAAGALLAPSNRSR